MANIYIPKRMQHSQLASEAYKYAVEYSMKGSAKFKFAGSYALGISLYLTNNPHHNVVVSSLEPLDFFTYCLLVAECEASL